MWKVFGKWWINFIAFVRVLRARYTIVNVALFQTGTIRRTADKTIREILQR